MLTSVRTKRLHHQLPPQRRGHVSSTAFSCSCPVTENASGDLVYPQGHTSSVAGPSPPQEGHSICLLVTARHLQALCLERGIAPRHSVGRSQCVAPQPVIFQGADLGWEPGVPIVQPGSLANGSAWQEVPEHGPDPTPKNRVRRSPPPVFA